MQTNGVCFGMARIGRKSYTAIDIECCGTVCVCVCVCMHMRIIYLHAF